MKKISYIILFISVFFIGIVGTHALKCEYSDGKLTATFEINEKKNTVGDAIINGTLNSSDETEIEDEEQSVENWDSIFEPGSNPDEPKKISAKGADYYANNKKCPPYSIFVDRSGQYDFAVFSESHKNEFKKYGEAKQGYAIMKLVSSTADPETDGGDVNHEGGSCIEYTNEKSCEHNEYFACIWNETEYGEYCNTDTLQYVQCGDAFDIPHEVPELFSVCVNLLKIAAPIILIVISIITLLKALAASSEDEIKKAQKSLIRKIVAAVMIFLIISIVQFVILKVADTAEQDDVSSCLTCFLNNDCENSVYYKTNVGGKYICTYLESGTTFMCEGNE